MVERLSHPSYSFSCGLLSSSSLTQAQRWLCLPGLKYFLGKPAQPRLTPPLDENEIRNFKIQFQEERGIQNPNKNLRFFGKILND